MNSVNTPTRPIRHGIMDSPSKLCANPYKVLRVANPVENLIDGSRVSIGGIKVFCDGPTPQVALMLGDGTSDGKTAGTIRVGENYAGGEKRVELPCEGLSVRAEPLNPQDASWDDTFTTRVEGNQLYVARNDGHGEIWGQELELQWIRRPKVEIVIGAHEGPEAKEIELPQELSWSDFDISGTPINEQQPFWTDRFGAEINGNTLRVFRTDQEGCGWAQPLCIAAYRK